MNRAAERDKAALHISLPDSKLRVERQAPYRLPIAQCHRSFSARSRWPCVDPCSSVRPTHRQPANGDEAP
jgi:hypothetical protein